MYCDAILCPYFMFGLICLVKSRYRFVTFRDLNKNGTTSCPYHPCYISYMDRNEFVIDIPSPSVWANSSDINISRKVKSLKVMNICQINERCLQAFSYHIVILHIKTIVPSNVIIILQQMRVTHFHIHSSLYQLTLEQDELHLFVFHNYPHLSMTASYEGKRLTKKLDKTTICHI